MSAIIRQQTPVRESQMTTSRGVNRGRRIFLEGVGAAGIAAAYSSLWPLREAFGAEAPRPGPADWPRFAYDMHNTRFNAREKTIGPANV